MFGGKEGRDRGEKEVAEELAEIMAKTSVEQVWESFDKVREKWKLETEAAASQLKRGGDRDEQEEWRMNRSERRRRERQEWRERTGD